MEACAISARVTNSPREGPQSEDTGPPWGPRAQHPAHTQRGLRDGLDGGCGPSSPRPPAPASSSSQGSGGFPRQAIPRQGGATRRPGVRGRSSHQGGRTRSEAGVGRGDGPVTSGGRRGHVPDAPVRRSWTWSRPVVPPQHPVSMRAGIASPAPWLGGCKQVLAQKQRPPETT